MPMDAREPESVPPPLHGSKAGSTSCNLLARAGTQPAIRRRIRFVSAPLPPLPARGLVTHGGRWVPRCDSWTVSVSPVLSWTGQFCRIAVRLQIFVHATRTTTEYEYSCMGSQFCPLAVRLQFFVYATRTTTEHEYSCMASQFCRLAVRLQFFVYATRTTTEYELLHVGFDIIWKFFSALVATLFKKLT